MMSILKTVGLGLGLLGTGYLAYREVKKAFGGSPLAESISRVPSSPPIYSPGKTGYRDENGVYHKVRSYRSEKDKQDVKDAQKQTSGDHVHDHDHDHDHDHG